MREMLLDPAFWQATTGFAWPIAIVVLAVLFRRLLGALLQREKLTIKVAGMEISVAEATEQTGKSLTDLATRVAHLEGGRPKTAVGPSSDGDTDGLAGSILWGDDVPSNNAFLIEELETQGFRISKELSTNAALNALQTDTFDMIISDLGRVEAGGNNPNAGLDLIVALRKAGLDLLGLIFAGARSLKRRSNLVAAGATDVAASSVDVFAFVESYRKTRI